MPYVLGKCGIILGLALIVACGLLCKTACHSLVLSTKRAAVDSYEALCETTFGTPGRCEFHHKVRCRCKFCRPPVAQT